MENKSHAFIAGLFALVLGAAVIFALFWFRGTQENLRDYVVVTKHSIGGLNPQAQVRYRGIRVGKVTDIRLDRDNPSDILIKISIADDIPLTKGTVATLSYQGSPESLMFCWSITARIANRWLPLMAIRRVSP